MCHDIENVPTLEAIFEAPVHGTPVNVVDIWCWTTYSMLGQVNRIISRKNRMGGRRRALYLLFEPSVYFCSFILILIDPSTVRMLAAFEEADLNSLICIYLISSLRSSHLRSTQYPSHKNCQLSTPPPPRNHRLTCPFQNCSHDSFQ